MMKRLIPVHSYIYRSIHINPPKYKNKFLMIRHGESVWNLDSKFTGWTNIPLTEKGKKEAVKIAKSLISNKLIPDIIFTSVLARTIDTCNIINKVLRHATEGIPVHTSWRLNEKHYGTLEGIPRQFIREKYGDEFTKMMRHDFYMKPPFIKDAPQIEDGGYPIYRNCYFETIKNGESKENVLQRLLPYYENDILYTLSEDKFPLVVTHKHTARVLMKHLLKMNDHDFQYYELPSKKIFLCYLRDDLSYAYHTEYSY